MIRRREFIAEISPAAWPVAVRTQQGERVRVGVLTYGFDMPNGIVRLFRDDLEQFGWSEGRDAARFRF